MSAELEPPWPVDGAWVGAALRLLLAGALSAALHLAWLLWWLSGAPPHFSVSTVSQTKLSANPGLRVRVQLQSAATGTTPPVLSLSSQALPRPRSHSMPAEGSAWGSSGQAAPAIVVETGRYEGLQPLVSWWQSGLVDTRYYDASALDVLATPRLHIDLYYPQRLSAAGSGRMLVEVYIDEQGLVDDVLLEPGQANNPLSQLIIESFMAARFNPAVKDGVYVKSKKIIEVEFGDDLLPP